MPQNRQFLASSRFLRLFVCLLSCDKLLYAFNGLFVGKTCKSDAKAHDFNNSMAIFVYEIGNIQRVFLRIRLNRLYPIAYS